MLPARNRLSKKEEIEEVYKKGNLFSFGDISLKKKENDLKEVRAGFLLRRGSAQKAIERNKVKRKLRGLLALYLEKITPGNDILITYSGTANNFDRSRVKKSMERILSKSKLLK